jgi:excisionase family DNA binding protein
LSAPAAVVAGPRLLEVREVARYLKACPDTVFRLIRKGKLPAIRFGTRSWRIDPRDLQAFLDAHRTRPR